MLYEKFILVLKMSERYVLSGVQLGLLIELDKESRKKLINEIIDRQFIGNSKNNIEKDVEKWAK